MPQSLNKITQFWHELKRRGVIKTIVMYAGGAFVLFDLANNVVAPLNLPNWTPRLVIIIALVGFPIMVVLSWIFDITPQGIDKTEALEEISEREPVPPSGKKRLKASDVIIVALMVVVAVLLYPRIFGAGSVNAMTVPVTVVNEFGERETRRVFKEDYLTRLALFPFSNETNDSSENWMGWGIMEAVLEDQHQFPSILIDWDDATRLNEQIDFAKEGKYPYFLTGSYQVEGNTHEINTRLYQTSNGSVRVEHIYRGTDFFNLVDSICVQVRSDLSISEVILNATTDLPITDLMTDNLEAYRNYILGRYWSNFDNGLILPLKRAIQLDSTFAKACYRFAYWCYNYQLSDESAISNINQAIRHRHRLSEFSDIQTRILYYLIIGDISKVIELSEYHYELRPRDLNLLNRIYTTYCKLNLLDRVIDAAIRMNELIPKYPPYMMYLADSYLLSGRPGKSLDVLNAILKEDPSHVEALLKIGEAYLQANDLEAAEEAFRKAIILRPEQEKHWSMLLDHIAFIRNHEITEEFLNSYGITLRSEDRAFSNEIRVIKNQLSFKAKNQRGIFVYPVSDTVFVYAWKDVEDFDFLKCTWFFSSSGKAIRVIGEQWIDSDYLGLGISWIEDSFILEAKDLLAEGANMEALVAFRKAYDQNPEHYYLANFIQHLEFVLSSEFNSLRSVFSSYDGFYSDLRFHMDDGSIFYTDYEGLTYELLPLSEDTFMVPSKYILQVQVVKDQDMVSGLKFLYRDGTEEFFPKTINEI